MMVVTGFGHVLIEEEGEPGCDPRPFLKQRKNRKYMGTQDDLAVVSAGMALASAGLVESDLGDRAGLYLSVGHIPFERCDVDPVLAASIDDEGEFSLRRFADEGHRRAHPLTAFRCLPNMPAFHISANFDLRGSYMVSYPGAGQVYALLDEAEAALREGRVDVALVGGVACQRNFLVEHHFRRIRPAVAPERLRDAGALLVLETQAHAKARGARIRGRCVRRSLEYRAFDAREALFEQVEELGSDATHMRRLELSLGPASLPWALSSSWGEGRAARVVHRLESRDGVLAESVWVSA
ncbi:MAG: hypothetical protein GXP55_05455 [Deltaproteobacteria bacterium]|nr:hypothetical protein [Deltaproteobacteria bacterium]